MSKPIKVGDASSIEALNKAYETSKEHHDRERLMAIRLASHGKNTLEQIGSILKRGRATIARWLKSYREGGIENLLHRGHGGRTVSLSDSDREALTEKLLSGCWKRAKDIQTWLHQERGVDLKLGGVYHWLHRMKGSWKLPRPRHKGQNAAKLEEFRKEIVSRLEALDIPIGVPVHIWIEDEHRSGLKSVLRRCWTIKGHEVTAPHQDKYEWSYVYGAADIVTSRAEFLYTPTVSLEYTRAFLKQLAATDPGAIHIVIWDRAGYHPESLNKSDGKLFDVIRFVPLEPYSPELNPIEPLWDRVKDRLANEVWESLDNMESAITEVLKPFWDDVKNVWSLLGNTWLTRGVIIFLQHRLE